LPKPAAAKRWERAEIIALYHLKGHAKLYRGTEIEANSGRAFAKLDAFVPAGFAAQLEKVKALILPADKLEKDYSGKEALINDLTETMLKEKTCHIKDHSFYHDEAREFRIDPLKFFNWRGGLYIFVRTTDYGDIRILAVERMGTIVRGKDAFVYPADFNPDKLLESAFGIIYDDPVTVRIRFSAGQARYIRERRWAADQALEEEEDGSIILAMSTSGWWEVRQWILSFGPEAELLEPPASSIITAERRS